MFTKSLRFGIYAKLTGTLLIVVIPLYFIGILMNQSGTDLIREGNYRLMEQKTDFMITSIDSELRRISQLQTELMNDSDLQALSIRSASLSNYEWTKSVNDLYKKLTMLASSSKYINEAFVLMPNIGKRLSSISKLENLNMSETAEFKQPVNPELNLLYMQDKLYMVLGYPFTNRTQYLLIIDISLGNIRDDLSFFGGNSSNATYLLDEQNEFILSSNTVDTDRLQIFKQHDMGQQHATIDGASYLLFTQRFPSLNWTLITALKENDVLASVNSFKRWYWILSAIAVLIIFIVSLMIYGLIQKPLRRLLNAFRKVEDGQLDVTIRRKGRDEFHYLYEQFNRMVSQLKKLIQDVYEQTIHSQKSELKQLQAQINPHFLYNSLYILYRMAQNEDLEGVSNLSKHLGDYYKFITQNKLDMISLEHEVHHAKTYAAIQQTRFINRISCSFEVSGSYEGWEVPRLIVQPVVENAFLHGLEEVHEGGIIVIRVIIEPNKLLIEVSDNGIGMEQDQLEEWRMKLLMNQTVNEDVNSNGIWNVHRRLVLHYGRSSGLHLRNNDLGGLTVELTIYPQEGETLE